MAKAIVQNKTVEFWCEQISIYEKGFQRWGDRGKKIVKRYKSRNNDNTSESDYDNLPAKFNILWSNVQTLAPALYAKSPIPNVDRRFEDNDKVGTTAARVLERASSYFIDTDLFDSVMTQCVQDRLLPGRGVAWVRYKFEDQSGEITDDVEKGSDLPEEANPYTEDVVVDYVHWGDFGHTWARTWQETRGVWRIVYMSRDEMKKRGFPDWKTIPLEKSSEDTEEKQSESKAKIYEIWDKVKKEAVWIHKGMENEQDKRPDPLGIKDFFPCPKPLYATLGNDNLIPTADFDQYNTQARELDDLTARIASIQKALKVMGVYDASAEGLDRLLSEGIENTMVPVEQWAIFGEKGGLKGAVDWFPIEQVAQTLVQLYEVRNTVKQDIYEITGISDIIRGATDAGETATAQEIKGKFATLRLDNMQKDVARFSRDLVRITAEIVAEHFSLETIKAICGIKLLTANEKKMLEMQASQPGPDGQPPQPLPDEMQELLDSPTWEEVDALLRDDIQRCFRISIETDSTIKQDQEAEKQARIELVGAVGSFMEQAAMLPPTLQPLAAELLRFGIKGFKISRELETTFDVTLKKITKQAEAPPQPDPAQQTEEAKLQLENKKIDMESQKSQGDFAIKGEELKLKQQELGLKHQELQQNTNIEGRRIDADMHKAKLDAKVKASPEQAMVDPELNEGEVTPLAQMIQAFGQMMMQGFQEIAKAQADGNTQVIQAIAAPRTTEIVRDQQGRIAKGVSTVQ